MDVLFVMPEKRLDDPHSAIAQSSYAYVPLP